MPVIPMMSRTPPIPTPNPMTDTPPPSLSDDGCGTAAVVVEAEGMVVYVNSTVVGDAGVGLEVAT